VLRILPGKSGEKRSDKSLRTLEDGAEQQPWGHGFHLFTEITQLLDTFQLLNARADYEIH